VLRITTGEITQSLEGCLERILGEALAGKSSARS
jgi:hypothetical protein